MYNEKVKPYYSHLDTALTRVESLRESVRHNWKSYHNSDGTWLLIELEYILRDLKAEVHEQKRDCALGREVVE